MTIKELKTELTKLRNFQYSKDYDIEIFYTKIELICVQIARDCLVDKQKECELCQGNYTKRFEELVALIDGLREKIK
jgi:hypothetical protein